MDVEALIADIAQRWERVTTVDSLLDAVERGDVTAVRTLTGGPIVRSALDAELWTRLQVLACLAVSGCDEFAGEALAIVRRDPHLARSHFSGGQTLLHRAAAVWSGPFAEALLERGADPNACDLAGHPPLYYAGNAVPGLDETPAKQLIALFHKYDAGMDAAGGVKRCTALHMAARRGHAVLAEALVRCGADIEARDTSGETPLRRTVNCGRPALVRLLLSLGADRSTRCIRGCTPLEAARSTEIKELLSRQSSS